MEARWSDRVGGRYGEGLLVVGRVERCVVGGVPGGRHDQNALARRVADRRQEGVGGAPAAQTQVDHPRAMVGREDDAGRDGRPVARIGGVEHFDRQHRDAGRDAHNAHPVVDARGRDACHVRPVALVITGIGVVVHEIADGGATGDDASRQVLVAGVDAGIHDGDDDAGVACGDIPGGFGVDELRRIDPGGIVIDRIVRMERGLADEVRLGIEHLRLLAQFFRQATVWPGGVQTR